MKKYIIYGLIALTSFNLSSCSDILDVDPVDALTDAAVWSDLKLAETYLNTSYSKVKAEVQEGVRYASLSDEIYHMHLYGTDNYRQGRISMDNSHLGYGDEMWNPWIYYFKSISEVNLFFEKIEGVPTTTEREEKWKNQLIGQAHFLRAYFYYQLFTHFGKVPLITHTYDLNTESFTETRASIDEVANFIVKECDLALQSEDGTERLPIVYSSDGFGRATKGAVLALKARALLFHASPLCGTSSADKWKKAADASKAVIDLVDESGKQVYSLRKVETSEEYGKLFYDKTNPEIIFMKMFDSKGLAGTNSVFLHQAPCGGGRGFGDAWGTLQPTQNLVDKFQKKDGTFSVMPDTEIDYNPWQNRDIRFDATIFVDGSYWGIGEDYREVEFFIAGDKQTANGKDSKAGPAYWNATKTGYLMKKFLDPSFDTSGTLQNTSPWIFMRLAEFYLNYAECQIKLGNNAEALKYLNEVRSRVNMPNLKGNDIWAEYENERQIELVFEGQRWFDQRRWMVLEDSYNNNPLKGIEIKKYADGTKKYARLGSYIETRVFNAPRQYWNPIPRSEWNKATQLDKWPYE